MHGAQLTIMQCIETLFARRGCITWGESKELVLQAFHAGGCPAVMRLLDEAEGGPEGHEGGQEEGRHEGHDGDEEEKDAAAMKITKAMKKWMATKAMKATAP